MLRRRAGEGPPGPGRREGGKKFTARCLGQREEEQLMKVEEEAKEQRANAPELGVAET